VPCSGGPSLSSSSSCGPPVPPVPPVAPPVPPAPMPTREADEGATTVAADLEVSASGLRVARMETTAETWVVVVAFPAQDGLRIADATLDVGRTMIEVGHPALRRSHQADSAAAWASESSNGSLPPAGCSDTLRVCYGLLGRQWGICLGICVCKN
jgi:hypothetical protein